MRLQFEEYILDIAESVSKSLGDTLDISTTRWISRPTGKELVKDASLALYVDGVRRSDDIVLIVSNPTFPRTVQADVARAREVSVQVSQRVGRHIAAPVNEGVFGEQTYAAYPRLSPLSEFRLVKALQKTRASKSTLTWILELAKETQKYRDTPEDYERFFVKPLAALCNDEDLSHNVRDKANEYLEFVRKSRTDFFTVVEHGDFWIGNVFFERRALPNINPYLGQFIIIDWRGARMDGYPCIDWMRFCSSIFKTGSIRADNFTHAYCSSLGISKYEFQVYCFLAMGRFGSELDQFPKERYVALCQRVLRFIQAHCLEE